MSSAPCLVRDLRQRGAVLFEDHGRLIVDAPPGILTEATKAALRELKSAVLAVLRDDNPIAAAAPPPDRAVRVCYGCRGRRFWRSVYDVTICSTCHPPAAPDLVAGWIEPGGIR